jgi:Phytanoyl-CoA dioxygenase (PhyH)
VDSNSIRMVTDPEVDHLRDHGWVKLERLIPPSLAERLLERAKTHMGTDATQSATRLGVDMPNPFWQDYHDIVQEDEAFATLGLDPAMGENAKRLMKRNVGVLMWSNLLAVKIGIKQARSGSGTNPTIYHQDGPELPIDRADWVRFWIALNHITPVMGPINFIDGSHRRGLLGHLSYLQRKGPTPSSPLLDMYPELREMSVTEPFDLQPGDATAHLMYSIHGAPVNETAVPRWALILTYFADDAIFTGGLPWATENIGKAERAGMQPGQPFGGPMYPRVCS